MRFVNGFPALPISHGIFHLSMQSGCDTVLRRMNRHYTADEYRTIVRNLRAAFENAAITTDIMVGFAGETDEEFAESLAFAEEIAFAKVHVFVYFRSRPGPVRDLRLTIRVGTFGRP